MLKEEKIDKMLEEHKEIWRKQGKWSEQELEDFAIFLKALAMGSIKPERGT